MNERAQFEKTYRDRITGYTGVATARTEHLSGSAQVQLTSIGKDGRPEDVWINEVRLEEVPPQESLGFRSDSDGPHAVD